MNMTQTSQLQNQRVVLDLRVHMKRRWARLKEIYEKFREKHGKKFKPEQLRAWANMMQLDKHSSLDEPPSGRFF